jgi:uncharacterized protein (TIGR02147 family)
LEHYVPEFVESSTGSSFNERMETETQSVQTVLLDEFSRRVKVNPRYSLRAYSKALGLSSGALSEILRKRRPVSLKAAEKIAKALRLSATETKRLFQLVQTNRPGFHEITSTQGESPEALAQRKLDEDTFALISEWYHFAILNLMDCEGFRWNPQYISKRLGLTNAQARLAMDLLLRVRLVQLKDGRVKASSDYLVSPSGVPSSAIRSYHRQVLEKAIEALETQDLPEREMNGIGIAVDPKQVPQIKREISDFLDQLATKYSAGKRHEVYFLETALFRMTKGERSENN